MKNATLKRITFESKPVSAGPSQCLQNRGAASHRVLHLQCQVSRLDPGHEQNLLQKGGINLDQEGTDKGSALFGEFLERVVDLN